ncbi:MAG TPA: hypothetical protein EYP98_05060 [Planctomycetes bacterium]|nr:hypothetical protein [Planctomycetota bacterium]
MAEDQPIKAATKVMAMQMRWSCALQHRASGELTIVHGSMLSELRPMESQHAPIVFAVYRQLALIPHPELVKAIFGDRVEVMNGSDLHPSMLAALRMMAKGHWLGGASEPADAFLHSGAPQPAASTASTSHLRCGVHRLRTAELHTLSFDKRTDSFLLNISLSLRIPAAIQPIRRRIKQWASSVRMLRGERPAELVAWRDQVLHRFCRRVDAGHHSNAFEVRRLHAWRASLNGDGRKPRPEHWQEP